MVPRTTKARGHGPSNQVGYADRRGYYGGYYGDVQYAELLSRSKSDCDWTPVEDEGDHTPSTDLNSASPIPTVTGAQHLGVKLQW